MFMVERKKSADNKKKTNILISVFCMICLSNDTLLFGTNANESVKVLGYAGMLFIMLYWIFHGGRISKNAFCLATVLVVCGLLTIVTTFNINIKYAYNILLILIAAFFTSQVKLHDFIRSYQKIMMFLAVYSVVVFFVYEIAYSIMSVFPIVENEAGFRFFCSIFDLSLVETPYQLHRSFGIFREPGVYMIFLILAIVFELFFTEKSSLKKLIIFMIALVLTQSTAGYIILVGIVLAHIFFTNKHVHTTQKKIRKLFLVGLFLGILWVLIDVDVFYWLFGKVFSESTSKTSRFDSIIININILLSDWYRILTGVGFDVVESSFRVYASKIGSTATDNTNTIFRLMATYGLVYISILVCMWYKFFKKIKGPLLAFCVFGIFILCLFTESLIVNIMLYLMAFYALEKNDHESVEERINAGSIN